MKGNYRISAIALEDIDKIWIYTLENWSLNQANRYYRLIYQEIEFLLEDFESGKDISTIKPGYRQARVQSHLIIYRKADEGVFEIIRVLHQIMDIQNKL